MFTFPVNLPGRDMFDIAYASHRQRRDAEYLQSTGR